MSAKKYAIIGGSSGIGLALVKRLSEAGHQVIVVSRTSESLAGLSQVEHIACDLTQDEVSTEWFGDSLDGLAYCPGTINLRSFRSLSPQLFRDDFELNVVGAVKVIQAALKPLKASGQGSVLLFSTVAATQGMSFHASIAASKGAIEGLTRSLAAELAPLVRVNALAPSLTETPLSERLVSNDEKRKAAGDRHALKRIGQPADFAELGQLLLTEAGSWITGQVIGVDGGLSTLR
ncbi:MAG: SDR family NAD(P)-dependent oxidoreductase [Pirellulaceae bacterium]|nr:SDR family NAD(P)-dependent oxidoreductase [Pirellulaceae bacterium]